ncbi:MAG: non-hydrolyzing UDP-N-acetylglucosamine 2-epimerase [Oligoflexales bacterium]
MKTIHVIIGTRPEAVKIAPVFLALQGKNNLRVRLISTGQHRDLLGQTLSAFGLKPFRDLKVMIPGQSLSQLTANLLVKFEGLFGEERPDLVLAHGDTTTCYASALSCFYHSIPFFHVEAGLRTYRLDSPYPEEFNRQCVTQMASHHFTPCEQAKNHLLSEGIDPQAITVAGNTVHDAIRLMLETKNEGIADADIIQKVSEYEKIAVLTMHRRETGSDSLSDVLTAIKQVAAREPSTAFVFPVHPNPQVKTLAEAILSGTSNVLLTPPLNYPDFLSLLSRSSLVLTDSGGVQEEAAYFGRKVLVLRDTTERNDGFAESTTKIIGTNPENVIAEISASLSGVSVRLTPDKLFSDSHRSPSQIVADVVDEKCRA